ncbi:MAG: roadblock/LC7 domain-containing protein, partial [Candidatus Obscuribacterales bacterium]|nr:roadblock/LC7 domain-containing protein [Candidatus Obscuribacterales bacterium]
SQQPKAWSDEAEQLETGFWQAFTPEQGSGLSGPAGQLSGQPASAQSAPPPPLPTPLSPPPPPVPMGTLLSPPPTPMAMPPAPPAPLEASQQANQKQEDVVISRFDIPIQERMAMNQAQAPQIQPAAPPPPPVPENLLPKATAESAASEPLVELSSEPKSIISRLSSILGDAPGQAATPQLMSDQNVDLGQPMMAADVPMPSPSAQSPAPPPQPQVTQQPAPPPPVPVPAASMQPAAEVQAQPSSGLFNVDERTIDKIFSENLGIVDAGAAVNPGQAPVTNQAVQAAPQAIPVAPPAPQAPIQSAPAAPVPHPASQPPPAPQAPVQKKEPGLFADMDDAAIDQLFSSNLGISEPKATQAQVNAQSIPQPIPAAPPLPPPVPQQAIPQQVVPPPQPAPVAPPPIQAAVPQPVIPPPVQEIPQPIITTPPAPVEAQPIEIQPAPDFSTQQAPPPPPPPTEIPVAMAPPAPQVPPVQADQSDGILNVTESDLDKLFSENLGVSESALSAAPKVNLTQAVETIRQATGSTQATPPPKIEGVGRLAKNVDTTQDTSSGKISSIGKFLLDQKDLAKLGKVASSSLSSTDMRVLTMEAAQELQNLLGHIGSQPGVAGSVIVGHDGILIANNLPPGHDAESVGVWALGIFLNTENTIKMLGHNHVFQMVARTPQGFLVIADFGGGILVTVSQSSQTNELIPLMRTITQLVAQTAH